MSTPQDPKEWVLSAIQAGCDPVALLYEDGRRALQKREDVAADLSTPSDVAAVIDVLVDMGRGIRVPAPSPWAAIQAQRERVAGERRRAQR